MTLSAGTRLGPYEVLSPLGAGGMGEVWRARDTRLDREVAVKVLPEEVAGDARALARFESEARAVAALSHPNILALHDVGKEGSVSFVVTELLEGETLRKLLTRGPLPLKKVLDVAIQIAEGLAAAHAKGIVHRDVKPENVFLTKDGHVKLLDFGLARHDVTRHDPADTRSPTLAAVSQKGVVLGTVSYMSPEQARGETVDFRSDQFSLGILLYEMLTGQRPFRRRSDAETLAAILGDDPPSIKESRPAVPAPVCWVVERCLAKNPQERFAATPDLAGDLAAIRGHLADLFPATSGSLHSRRGNRVPNLAAAGLFAAGLLAGGIAGSRLHFGSAPPPEPPSFQRLTWRRGTVLSARFAPDGKTILYSASWDGKQPAVFLKNSGSPDAVPLDLPSAMILGISPEGEMALQLGRKEAYGNRRGTLARAPLTGGTPREIAEDVYDGDWGPGGRFVVAREMNGRCRLEYPLGTVLYETSGQVRFPRFSVRENVIAFVDYAPQKENRATVAIVDLQGNKRTLSREFSSIEGLAWSPSGDEVWFTASTAGTIGRQIWGVSLSGANRVILRVPGDLRLLDVTPSGQALLTRNDTRVAIRWLPPGAQRERDLSWFGYSILSDLSRDGKSLLFSEASLPAGTSGAVALCRSDGAPVRLGDGGGGALSPDGKWAVSRLAEQKAPIVLLPTGPGEPKRISSGVDTHGSPLSWSAWLPDGKNVVLVGREATAVQNRLFVQGLDGGKPHAVSPEGIRAPVAVSTDGEWIAAAGPDGRIRLYPVDGGEARILGSAVEGDLPLQWAADDRFLYVLQRPSLFSPVFVFQIDLVTNRRSPWKVLLPEDPAGVAWIAGVRLTPDGLSYAYTYSRVLSDLYLAEGLR